MSKHGLVTSKSSKLLRKYVKEKPSQQSLNSGDVEEEEYPEPRPPKTPKDTIFNPKDFTKIHQHVKQTPEDVTDSYTSLVEYLVKDLDTDLAKLRAIYYWIVTQKVPVLLCQKDIPSPDTPVGYLHLIRQKKGTYSKLLASMCKKTGLPCVIINGLAKSVGYDVGEKVDTKKFKNSWNAVYIEGDWRLVHPYWAALSARGYNTGRWALVDCPDFHDDGSQRSRSFIIYSMINDFFFLTDPEKFITKCFPKDNRWQLLESPITKEQFDDLPFLQPSFYELGFSVDSHKSCVIHAVDGKVNLTLKIPQESANRLQFLYKIYKLRYPEDEGEYDYYHLERYVLHHCKDNIAYFEIRFPPIAGGDYKLELHCKDPECPMPSDWICDYRIKCDTGMEECLPLPVAPYIGWGAGPELDKYGLSPVSHRYGVVACDDDLTTLIKFSMDSDAVEFHTELLNNSTSKSELNKCVDQEIADGKATFKVSPPHEGEFAFQIFCKNRGELQYNNVCNYLLKRSVIVENPSLSDLRNRLIQATENGDYDELSSALEECKKRGLEDRGDVHKAKRKLCLERINREIREAISNRDLEMLEKTMNTLSDTSLKKDLGRLVDDAEAVRTRLRKLKRLRHAVLEMDQKTISEIRSYPKPPAAVHGVMVATFLLLGNKEMELKKWAKVQGLISKRGKESLKRRVAAFDNKKLHPAALRRAKTILSRYDIETVQIASAGAATFYQWAITMVQDAESDLT